MNALDIDAAPFPAETYLTHDEICELTEEQRATYISFTVERFDRIAVKFVDALVNRWRGRVPVSVESLDLPVESAMEIVDVSDGLCNVVDVDVVAESLLLPIHGHVASPVVAESEPGRSDAPAMTVQETGGTPVAARAGACGCCAPADSSAETKDARRCSAGPDTRK